MRSATLAALLLALGVQAHPAAPVCKTWEYTTTTTFNDVATQHVVDVLGVKMVTSTFVNTKPTVVTTSNCEYPDSILARQVTTTRATTTSTRPASTTSTAAVVTNKAYIDTVLRQHNQHRLNHTVSAFTWNTALAETARKIANTCVYQHNTSIDCPSGGGCYGQNIGAGYRPTQMSVLITNGFYNSEINSYTYYGKEPDFNKFGSYGHMSQIVWKGTNSVGCYTMDCSSRAGGLTFPGGGGQGIPPFFTVCNYGPTGNYVGQFASNVLKPTGLPSIFAGYKCPTIENCEG